MANNKFINLEEASKITQALLSKINEQADLKVNKLDIESTLNEGIKIGTIDDIDFYAPEPEITEQSLYNILDNMGNHIQNSIPTNVSDLTNDVGYITSYTETDPTVPAWAKEANKPTYTATEVGALPDSTVITDEKLKVINNMTTGTYYPILTTNSADASTKQYDNPGLSYIKNSENYTLEIGNKSVSAPKKGQIQLAGGSTYGLTLSTASISGSFKTATFQNKTGTVALLDDIPSNISDLNNDSGFQTSSDVNSAIAAAIGNINSFEVKIVNTLPTTYEIGNKIEEITKWGTASPATLTNDLTIGNLYYFEYKDATESQRLNDTWGQPRTGTFTYTDGQVTVQESFVTLSGKTVTFLNFNGSDCFYLAIYETMPIDTHTVYLVSNSGSGTNIYDEYMYINNAWEKIGTTETDLTGYLQDSDIAAWAKAANKPTYTASEVGALPDNITIPSKTSDLTNDSGYVTSSDVSTAITTEFNALADVASTGDYGDLSNVPTNISEFVNNVGYITSYTETDPTVPSWAKASTKPSYTASEVGALPASTTYVASINGSSGAVTLNIPTDTSDLTNGAGFLTSYTETDPTVPVWAKASSKPSYTAAEVGAVAKTGDTMTGRLIIDHNASENNNGLQINFNNDYFAVMTAKGYTGSSNNYIAILNLKSNDNSNNGVILSGIETPRNNTEAANKKYVDDSISSLDKIKTTAGSDNTEYNLIGTASTNNNTLVVNVYQPTLLSFSKYTDNFARLTIGSTATPGVVRIYTNASGASGFTDVKSAASSTNERTVTFPDASGTVALTSDIPSISSWALASTKPSYTFSELTSHPTTLNDYGITDAYTKTEVDGMVSGVLHYKGTKAAVSNLPTTGNVTGDVWHITADGSEYAWDGSTWQELGTATDLSGYVPTSRTVNGKALSSNISLTASDVSALPASTTYVSSFNGSSGAITYTAPVTSVNGQTGAVTAPNTTYTLSMSGNRITLTPNSGTASYVDLPVYDGSVT